MSPPIIASNSQVDFTPNELLGVAYEPRLKQWYSVHAVLTDNGWTAERRDMRPQAHEPADNAIAHGLLDAVEIPRLDENGRVLLLWERIYRLAELRLRQAQAPARLPAQPVQGVRA